ncbi:hypothetical protein CABS01_01389 [Colletotrichum abscissum]|uniref:Uncharacterized protein n=1 Tax=Colletotrichum abscissum TaxID=1671311 RepID=A0A9P9X3N9_9PEZI|nr:uncharacterized protein CABS01_01389 [Colletotrichum abscissum]KAI3535060.1 hypothetical protein CABS02_13017 [Colletotrichum abscissum]KAK1495582.1 hypothetical protein CABS01_01389 [Colletotrichum abscissum]
MILNQHDQMDGGPKGHDRQDATKSQMTAWAIGEIERGAKTKGVQGKPVVLLSSAAPDLDLELSSLTLHFASAARVESPAAAAQARRQPEATLVHVNCQLPSICSFAYRIFASASASASSPSSSSSLGPSFPRLPFYT